MVSDVPNLPNMYELNHGRTEQITGSEKIQSKQNISLNVGGNESTWCLSGLDTTLDSWRDFSGYRATERTLWYVGRSYYLFLLICLHVCSCSYEIEFILPQDIIEDKLGNPFH